MTVERVFLVGLSGSGKTTVGRQLSRRLGWKFADTDEAIESRSGRTVASIFAADGEERFRDLEEEALRDVAGSTEIVIATGGGVPLRETNRKVLATGLVIWLDITARAAESRLAGGGGAEQRPLLAGDTGSRLESLFEQRRHLYERSDHPIAGEFYETGKAGEMAAELVERGPAGGWGEQGRRRRAGPPRGRGGRGRERRIARAPRAGARGDRPPVEENQSQKQPAQRSSSGAIVARPGRAQSSP